jgi:sugar lactone lactonase YvrE
MLHDIMFYGLLNKKYFQVCPRWYMERRAYFISNRRILVFIFILIYPFGMLSNPQSALSAKESNGRSSDSGRVEIKKLFVIEGFGFPETVKYDPALDCFFVSNMVGNSTNKDNNGFISRIDANNPISAERFVGGGHNSVVLHGPKGMAIQENVLWVADIDALRGFDTKTGEPVSTIDLKKYGAVSLNDLTTHPDGSLYITDPRIIFYDDGTSKRFGEDRIFQVTSDHKVNIAVKGDILTLPNGIEWDMVNKRFIIVPFGGTSIFEWRPGDSVPTVIGQGVGSYDGIEIMSNGALLVSSLKDGTIYKFSKGVAEKLITGLGLPGNFGMDTKRRRLAIPLLNADKVEIWKLK